MGAVPASGSMMTGPRAPVDAAGAGDDDGTVDGSVAGVEEAAGDEEEAVQPATPMAPAMRRQARMRGRTPLSWPLSSVGGRTGAWISAQLRVGAVRRQSSE